MLADPPVRICLGFTPLDGLPSPRLRSPIYPPGTGGTVYRLTVAGERWNNQPDLTHVASGKTASEIVVHIRPFPR